MVRASLNLSARAAKNSIYFCQKYSRFRSTLALHCVPGLLLGVDMYHLGVGLCCGLGLNPRSTKAFWCIARGRAKGDRIIQRQLRDSHVAVTYINVPLHDQEQVRRCLGQSQVQGQCVLSQNSGRAHTKDQRDMFSVWRVIIVLMPAECFGPAWVKALNKHSVTFVINRVQNSIP